MTTTNYFNTLIEVAEDCPINAAEIPPQKGDKKTIANLQFEMLKDNPYKYTSDDVIFSVFTAKNGIQKKNWDAEREKFFSKGQACFRCSPLTKRYGWGVHSNADGKIALYPMESEAYKKYASDNNLKQVKAMRSKRK